MCNYLIKTEMGRDWCNANGFQVVGGFISPASDAYGKKGLLAAHHRVAMSEVSVCVFSV